MCAGSTTGAQGPSDQLLLWAVEGLAGVVINGVPNNVPGTRALNTPRAVLWGQHDDLLTWPGRIWNVWCKPNDALKNVMAADFNLVSGQLGFGMLFMHRQTVV
jgi:hypothetical protein